MNDRMKSALRTWLVWAVDDAYNNHGGCCSDVVLKLMNDSLTVMKDDYIRYMSNVGNLLIGVKEDDDKWNYSDFRKELLDGCNEMFDYALFVGALDVKISELKMLE